MGSPQSDPKLARLRQTLAAAGRLLVAYSGGVDSAFLAWAAHRALGDRMLAVIADSPSLGRTHLDDALAFAREAGIPVAVIETRELENPAYSRNDAMRCFHCKDELFTVMEQYRAAHGFDAIAYGVNTDDQGDFRPGQQAARQHHVLAPLLEAGLGKAAIRDLSRRLGLPTWDKPAMPCLASRLPRGTAVTVERLALVEQAEAAVRALGYKTVRVRYAGDDARVELDPEGLRRVDDPAIRTLLVEAVRGAGFRQVVVDPRGYRPGGAADAAGAVGH